MRPLLNFCIAVTLFIRKYFGVNRNSQFSLLSKWLALTFDFLWRPYLILDYLGRLKKEFYITNKNYDKFYFNTKLKVEIHLNVANST